MMRSVVLRALLRGAWAPAGVVALHIFLVHGLDAYTRLPPLDRPMHVLGGAAIAYFGAVLLREAEGAGALTLHAGALRALFLLGLTALAAVAWELLERASDQVLGTGFQTGLGDTMRDLLLGLLGGAIFLLATHAGAGRRPDTRE